MHKNDKFTGVLIAVIVVSSLFGYAMLTIALNSNVSADSEHEIYDGIVVDMDVEYVGQFTGGSVFLYQITFDDNTTIVFKAFDYLVIHYGETYTFDTVDGFLKTYSEQL